MVFEFKPSNKYRHLILILFLFFTVSTASILKGVKNAPVLKKSLHPESESSKSFIKAARINNNNIKAALLQRISDEVYFILENLPTARQIWIMLKTYYQPHSEAVVDSLLEEFWNFSMSEGIYVDKYANELTQKQFQIASLDPSKRPTDTTKKNRLLRHGTDFNGYYGGAVAYLRLNTAIFLHETVNTLRESQAGLNRQHEAANVAYAKEETKSVAPQKNKSCACC
ncbi:hypothetical protein OnM2_025096 [Erysiphe neolycopersici]|uniref:Uncharacterized protein n=1 Tax=Erysiphe neolycopersici TaxID=212602 RepID=A0A420I185_9PEZI|nr:hypothetical protein OnM2_025096 [Erysiphe neolycopersici]